MKELFTINMGNRARSMGDCRTRDELRTFLSKVKNRIAVSVASIHLDMPAQMRESLRQHFTSGKFVRTQAMFLLAKCR